MFKQHPYVIWMDSSVGFSGDIEVKCKQIMSSLRRNGGLAFMIGGAVHSTFWGTDPGLYRYLPPRNSSDMKEGRMLQSGAYAAARTRELYDGVFFWAYLCALTEDCTHPPGSIRQPCTWGGAQVGPHTTHAGCHRFDQSVLNILVRNMYGRAGYQKMHENYSIVSVRRLHTNDRQGYHGFKD